MIPEAQRRYQASEKGKATRRKRENAARAANREAMRAKDRELYALRDPSKKRDGILRWLYGITIVEWDALLAAQGGACAICGTTEPGQRKWATDHDHTTGLVRGILCHACNLNLAWLGDNADKIGTRYAKVQEYLAAPSPVPGAKAHPKLMARHALARKA